MKNKLSIFLAVFALSAVSCFAQTNLTATSTASAVSDNRTGVINVTSATGFTAGNLAYVDKEAMRITAINGTLISVVRGVNGTTSMPHATSIPVYTGSSAAFIALAPATMAGSCTAAQTFAPTIDTRSGDLYYCLNSIWNKNPFTSYGAGIVSSAVASAAGVITPSGSVFHITGALAITGFTLPAGFVASASQGGFCAIPDGTYTTTAAGNIALASTAVVSKLMCWKYDPGVNKFFPTY